MTWKDKVSMWKRSATTTCRIWRKRWRTITTNSCSGPVWKLSPEKSWFFPDNVVPIARNVVQNISVSMQRANSTSVTNAGRHGTIAYMYWLNIRMTPPYLRKRKSVTPHGKAKTTVPAMFPNTITSRIWKKFPNGTSVTVPCAGRTPRNTWERRVVNPYRMKTGCGISVHRHSGYRCF